MKFKRGDNVTKARPYSKEKYCLFGGDSTSVPIGSIGTILLIVDDNRIYVRFHNNKEWNVHPSELDLVLRSMKDLLEEEL